jgi:hypothetical protein
LALHPGAQQPSAPEQAVIAVKVQARPQPVPISVSDVQTSESSHAVGQIPSQTSPDSTTPLPQTGMQLGSLLALHPGAQQPSPPAHAVIGVKEHPTVQPPPVSASAVQLMPSLHDVGQFPSQVSPGSVTSLPQIVAQSVSLLALQPTGQHPSPLMQRTIGANAQRAVQIAGSPVRVLLVQTFPSSHEVGQSPSQSSAPSRVPFPQVAEQSSSVSAVQGD